MNEQTNQTDPQQTNSGENKSAEQVLFEEQLKTTRDW
jgi:hypothetical protein